MTTIVKLGLAVSKSVFFFGWPLAKEAGAPSPAFYLFLLACFFDSFLYTPFGNSMRSLALLRLVWGKDFWKSVRAASSWCFGRHGLEHRYFYLRSCRFGISLMCQFHWELDCVGFSPFEIWRCGCVEMMRGIGGFLFSI